MKPFSQTELQTFVECATELLEGSVLQEVISNDTGISLGFWKQRRIWLVVDLSNPCPLLLLFEGEKPPFIKKPKPKPVLLFLKSNVVGSRFVKFEVLKEFGRICEMQLASEAGVSRFEFSLIPNHVNFIIETESSGHSKKISWNKPEARKPQPMGIVLPAPRSLEEIHHEWLALQSLPEKPKTDPEVQWKNKINKEIEKKKKNLSQLLSQDLEADSHRWNEVGENLKAQLTESSKNHSEVYKKMNEAFQKSKSLREKKQGTLERIEFLKKEIARLETETFKSFQKDSEVVKRDLFAHTEARGRKLTLEDGLIAYLGKNAQDNLTLLRRAKAWDYWLHLKDYPGSHVIISRQRNQIVSEAVLHEVAKWLVEQTLAQKMKMDMSGVAVAYTECRFVRPIKGDRLGRVNYHEAKVLNVKLR